MGLDEAWEKRCNWWRAACGGQDKWRDTTRVSTQDSKDSSEAEVFPAHAPPQGACEHLVCALKLLANQQTGGDSLVDTLFEGLQEQSRLKIMDELRIFVEVANRSADLEK